MATVIQTQVGNVQETSTVQGEVRVDERWPLWQRVLFRLFFVYLVLQIAPWNWFDRLPFAGNVLRYWYRLTNWAVYAANDHVFHVRPLSTENRYATEYVPAAKGNSVPLYSSFARSPAARSSRACTAPSRACTS